MLRGENHSHGGAARSQLLQKDGEAWRVVFDGETFFLRDTVGIRYLAALLSNPRRKLPAAKLIGAREAGDAELVASPAVATWQKVAELSEDLEDAYAQNDIGRCHRARTALELAHDELVAAVDVGDPAGDLERERARKSVRNAIHRVIRSIRRISVRLADHLADTIRTGTYCAYRPDPYSRIEWQCEVRAADTMQSRNAA